MIKNIAVLSGDGIGPEIIIQAKGVLDIVAKKIGITLNYQEGLVGAIAIDQKGSPLPQETLDICLKSDVILFGAIGSPKYDNNPNASMRPEQGLLALRKKLGLFANIRPITLFKGLEYLSPLKENYLKDVDFVIYRELTGGIYFGDKGRKNDKTIAFDNCEYSCFEIQQIAKIAFEAAKKRRKKLTLVDKANVLETSRLWREEVQKLSKAYPEVQTEYLFVDNAAMQLITNPAQFDIILTENMFGDILSDEASVLVGSLGLLPSASIGKKTALFEPIHGSYPQATGKNIANPIGAILSVAMILEYFELNKAAIWVKNAVEETLREGIVTPDLNPNSSYGTTDIGEAIQNKIKQIE